MTFKTTKLQAVTREDVWFSSKGTRCAAWFYRPAASTDPSLPLVVMAHGLGGTRHMRLDAYARRFAEAGIAALVFDYRGFGDSEGTPRQIVDIRGQLDDWHAALAFARTELPVDRDRIAIWGTSFGGGHVLQISGEDRGLAAVVAQCPFTDGLASTIRRFVTFPPSAFVLILAAIVDLVGAVFGRRPLLMPMAGTRWMPAFLAAPDSLSGARDQAEPGTKMSARTSRWVDRFPSLQRQLEPHLVPSIQEVPQESNSLWGVLITSSGALVINAIAARLVLTLARYRPGRALRRSGDTPVLICACDHDTVAPVGPTVRAARGLRNVRVERYPYGHFEIYVGAAFEVAVADQLAFLRAHLQPADAERSPLGVARLEPGLG
jgi:pimeloyl-ACP methyl ester carboxylesterase